MPGPSSPWHFGTGDVAAMSQTSTAYGGPSAMGDADSWHAPGTNTPAQTTAGWGKPGGVSTWWGSVPAGSIGNKPSSPATPDWSDSPVGGSTWGVSGIGVSPAEPGSQAAQATPSLVVSSSTGSGPTGTNPSSGTNGASSQGTGNGVAPTVSFAALTFTVIVSSPRASSNGNSGRAPHDPVTNDHGGTGATEGTATDTGTVGNPAAMVGVANASTNASAGTATVPFAATAAPAPSVPIFGNDGRAVFDGSGGIVLAMGPSGPFSPGPWVGPQEALPRSGLPVRGSERGARTSAGDPADGKGAQTPRRSDLLTDFLPYDRTSLEQAIDRFLARFDNLGAELSRANGPTDLLTEIMAVAVAFTAAKVGLRLFWRSRDDEDGLADADLGLDIDPFPGTLDI